MLNSVESPVCKIRRTTSVVVEQPATDKILVENVPDMSSSSMEDVRLYYLFTVVM